MPFSWHNLIISLSPESKDWNKCSPNFGDFTNRPLLLMRIACPAASSAASRFGDWSKDVWWMAYSKPPTCTSWWTFFARAMGVPVYSGVEDLHYAALVLGRARHCLQPGYRVS